MGDSVTTSTLQIRWSDDGDKDVAALGDDVLGHPISSCRLLCIHFTCRFINIR